MFSGKLLLNDDSDDFLGDVESTRSNLSNIFGVSLSSNQSQQLNQQQNSLKEGMEQSLKYVSPKQQIKSTSIDHADVEKNAAWSIQIAKVVSAFKLTNQQNIPQGKVGLAILKNKDDQFKLILYRTKNNILSTITMNKNTKIFIKLPYFQFRDDLQIFWSILLENGEENAVIELIKGKVNIEEQKQDEIADGEEKNLNSIDKIINATENSSLIITSNNSSKNNKKTNNEIENYSSDEKLKETKAQILSRMAKMGQPLPNLTATTTDFSDSSDNEASKLKILPKPVAIPRKLKVQSQQVIAVAPTSSTQITPIPVVANLGAFNSNINMETQCLSMLLTENRTLNSELRMNMSKIETKIEKVLDKIDTIDSNTSKGSKEKCKDDEILELEEKLLQLKKENRSLKLKINELQNENIKEHHIETLTEKDIVEFQELIDTFNVKTNAFSSLGDLLKELLRKYDIHCSSLKETIENLTKTLEDNKEHFTNSKLELEQEKASIMNDNADLKTKISKLEKKLEELKEGNKDLLEQKKRLEGDFDKSVDTVIKDIMNNLYKNLVIKFEDDKIFTSLDVLKICRNAIKQEYNSTLI